MATRTSTQSGNFSATATWGGAAAPVDGDSFTVAAGHTVTIDTGISVPTNGYADSNVYGILQSQASASTTLRMNGRLYVQGGGTLHLRAGATIQVNGTSGDQHGIWIEDAASASCIMEGSDGMPTTTLSAAETVDSTSLALTSATDFAVGDWIAIYDNHTTVGDTNDHDWQHTDEGFWIHDISGNTVYFRKYVGPDDVTVSSVNSAVITVSNAKVFRAGQIIIFGTGSNRNIKTINSINYGSNEITCDSAITGTVTGEIVYLTGTEKGHSLNDKVRKMAAVTTATSTDTDTTITVSSSAGFQNGDEIWIEWRGEADSTTDYIGYYDGITADKTKHTISSIAGTTITLTAAISYNVVEGALVHRMTRDVVCETVASDGSDYAFFYNEYTAGYDQKFIMKDVQFRNWGNDDSNVYTGVVIRGFHSTDSLPVTLTETVPARGREPWIEGVVVHSYPETTHDNDWGGMWLYDARYAKPRCCFTMNGDEGFSLYYESGAAIANCISASARERAFRLEGCAEWYECAYLYGSRTRYGLRIIPPYEMSMGFHDIIIDAMIYGVNSFNDVPFIHRSKFTALRHGHRNNAGQCKLIYCKTKTLSGLSNTDDETGTPQDGEAYTMRAYRTSGTPPLISLEHNFEYDAVSIYGYRSESKWDNTERAWRFFRRYDADSDAALADRIFIPANTTTRISAEVKLSPGFSGTYPYLFAHDLIGNVGEDRINAGAADASIWAGKRYSAQYSVAAASAYEEEQITIASKPYSRFYYCGVLSNNRNAAEGYWVRNLRIRFDTPYSNPAFSLSNDSTVFSFSSSNINIRDSFTQQKRRWGG